MSSFPVQLASYPGSPKRAISITDRDAPLCRQQLERLNQHPLRLLVPHGPSVPALAERPLTDALLQADDVPGKEEPAGLEMPPRTEGGVSAVTCMWIGVQI